MNKRPLPFAIFILTIGVAALFLSAAYGDHDKSVVKNETASEHLNSIRNNQVTGQLNPTDYLRALNQVRQNESNRSVQAYNFEWELMGPNNLGGRTRAILFDNRDATGNTIYAGSVMGGIFRSDNGGAKWVKAVEEAGCLNVSCMTQAGNGDIYVGTGEGFSVQDYTILGKDWGYTTGFMGKGIFKSTDGQNFNLLPSTQPTMNGDNELEWGFINELAAHPANGALYASTNTGLKYSGDGGNSWQVAKTSDGADLNVISKEVKMGSSGIVIAEVNNLCYISQDGNPNNFVLQSGDSSWNIPDTVAGRIEFAIAPTNNDIIYALVVSPGGALVNVYRSEDKGSRWIVVGPGGSSNFNVFNTGSNISQGIGMFAATITVFEDDPYHVLVGGQDMWEGTKISETGFYQWVLRSQAGIPWLEPPYQFLWQGHHVYAFYPGSTTTCLVGTNGGISKGTFTPDNYEFQFMNKDYIASQFYTVSPTMEKKNVVGGAQDIGTIYIDGAANPSDSRRGNDIWTTQSDVPDGKTGGYCAWSLIYPTAVIYSRNPQPANNGNLETFVRRNEFGGGRDWAAYMFSDKYAASGFIPPFLLYENFEDYNTKDSVGFKITRNYPAGSTLWIESNNGNRPFKYVTPVTLNIGDSIVVPDIITARFFIGGDDRLMMSKQVIQFDKNPEWYVISDKAHQGVEGITECLAYSSDANHIFVGTKTGKLFRVSNVKYAYNTSTADVNSSYCIISTTRIPIYIPGTNTEISQVITSIAVDPNNDDRVIITLGNYGNSHYVMLCENALSENPTFRSVQGDPNSGGLPQVPVFSSLFEMNSDNHLVFAGTEYGIYVTDNISAANPTWVSENNNVGCIPVFMLKQQTVRKGNDTLMFVNIDTTYVVYYGVNNYGVIYGATYGRGIISLDAFEKPVGIGDPGKIDTQSGFKVYPNPASDKVTVAFNADLPGYVKVDIFSLAGNQVKTVDLGWRPEGRHDVIINCSGLPAGTYIVRLTTGNQASSTKLVVY
jgi:hypothetical protein